MGTAEKFIIDLSFQGGQFLITVSGPGITNTPTPKKYPEEIDLITNKVNTAMLNGGPNCLMNKFAQVENVIPMFYNSEGLPIPQTDPLLAMLKINIKNINAVLPFIAARMRELELGVSGFALTGLADQKNQMEKFQQMANIWADSVRDTEFINYTINGKPANKFNEKDFSKLFTMMSMGEMGRAQHPQWQ